MKERNRIATSNAERDRLKAGYGLWEANHRAHAVSTFFFKRRQNHTLVQMAKVRVIAGEKNSESD
jgi:hypothetical protein